MPCCLVSRSDWLRGKMASHIAALYLALDFSLSNRQPCFLPVLRKPAPKPASVRESRSLRRPVGNRDEQAVRGRRDGSHRNARIINPQALGLHVDSILAETTPGPLIMVTQFVGHLAAFRAPEPFTPLVAGLLGAALTTWVTFAPCFLWIFTFAPWIERMESSPRLKGGLAALTAAVVGVIANLTVWFFIHVLFSQVDELAIGPLQISNPVWATLDWRAAVLAALSAVLLFKLKWSIIGVLVVAAVGGLILGQAI